MGYGLPAAIGAKVARPDALIIDIDGDASFSMTLTELSTMAQFNIGAKVIILNNVSELAGMPFSARRFGLDSSSVKARLTRVLIAGRASVPRPKVPPGKDCDRRATLPKIGHQAESHDCFCSYSANSPNQNPDFVKLSEAMNIQAQRCIAPNDVEAKLRWLIESEGPALLEVRVDQKVPVLPMVAAGKALHEMQIYDKAFFGTGFGVMQATNPHRLYIPRGHDRHEFGCNISVKLTIALKTASRPALVHSISKQSVTASDDFYSLSSGESSQEEKSTVRRYQTPPLHTIAEPYRKKDVATSTKPTIRKIVPTPPTAQDTARPDESDQGVKIKRKPLSTESSPTYSNNEVISPPTPGVDDTPYIQFAIEQLTRDEEVHQELTSRSHGAPRHHSYPVDRLVPDERLRPRQDSRSEGRGERSLEPLRKPSDSSTIAIPATPTQDSFRFSNLGYVPKPLRLLPLIALIFCCVLMMTAVVFSTVWSSRHQGLWQYDDAGTARYFVFQYLPQILAVIIVIWIFVIVNTLYRIIPFSMMHSERRAFTSDVLHTAALFPSNYMIPHSWLRRDSSGLRWDPRSLADILVLFQRSNVLSDLYGSEVRPGRSHTVLPKKYTLRYWIAGKRSSEIFHGVEESQAPLRGFRHRESNEKQPNASDQQSTLFDLESQQPLKASTLDSLQKDVHNSRIRFRWLPWFLKDTFVVAWIVIAIVLMLAFIIVSFVNDAVQRGFLPLLPSPTNSQGFSPSDFLYSFIPCFIGMIMFLLWQPIDMYFRALEPFANLGASSRGCPAEQSLLLDYTACLPVEITIKAALAGHYKVAWISFISLLSATLPVLGGGVFTAQYFIPTQEVRMAASMPGYYALVVFVVIYSLSFLIIWPTQNRRLPHDIRTLGQILSFVYESHLLNDSAFWQPRSKVDLVTRLLGSLTGDKGSSRYAFGVYMGQDGREHLGIDRLHRPESGEMLITTGMMA
ncbi:MAG: hypothetical protein Q9188_006738 [Gyalolechia gomerana]